MKNFMRSGVVLVSILFLSHGLAADRVVVAPLDAVKKKLMHVVSVSARDGDFTDPVAAVNSIADATAANLYLVLIDPGVYTLTRTLVMKPFVTISGSGREATTLTGAISTFSYDASSAIISGTDNGVLCDLAVENTGGGGVSIALYNNGTSPVIRNVTATATGGTFNYGVYNEYSSA
ncbi:MAG: hypothetical protein ACYC9M_01180, partial [Desulfobulbaceae bacterium]